MPLAVAASLYRLKLCLVINLLLMASSSFAADAKPTPIADLKHDGPVDFEKEILPILKKNCTACHNKSKAESNLSLESPETILKGGSSGPGVVAGKGSDSLVITRAAIADDEQMPPADNKVGAKRLTSNELGLLKLWIDQCHGHRLEGRADHLAAAAPGNALDLRRGTHGGRAICGVQPRQSDFVYHVPSGRVVSRLTDPALLKSGLYDKPGVADLDLVRSLAFSPDGQTLASGGFRTIKLWKRSGEGKSPFFGGKLPAATSLAVASSDRKLLAFVQDNDVQLADLAGQKLTQKLTGHTAAVTVLAFSPDGTKLVTASADKTARILEHGRQQVAGDCRGSCRIDRNDDHRRRDDIGRWRCRWQVPFVRFAEGRINR